MRGSTDGGSSSDNTWLIRRAEGNSSPLAALTTTVSGAMWSARRRAFSRNRSDGTAMTVIAAPGSALRRVC